MRRLSFTLFLCIPILFVNAQSFKQNGAIRFNMLGGYNVASNDVWKTHQSLNGQVGGFEIGISKITDRSQNWHKIFGTPRIGVNLQTIFMNKPDTFGTCISILPYLEMRMLTWPHSDLSAKISFGTSFCTKLFNNDHNFDNRAVSSPINFGLEFTAIYHHELSKKTELNLEAGVLHVSNGSLKLPNGGLNILLAKAGISYYFNEVPYAKRRGSFLKIYHSKPYYSGFLSFAYREQGTYWNKREFPIFTLHQSVMKQLNKIHTVGIGVDAFYDASPKLNLDPELKLMVSDVKEREKYHFAIGACYELKIHKFGIPVEAYHYMYNLNLLRQQLYVRFGLKYNPWKNLFVGCFVKGGLDRNNKFESSFMELATGWSFLRK